MGSACAPSIVNIFMQDLEINFLRNPDINPYFYNFSFYKSFLDDIFIVFQDGNRLPNFVTWINGIHDSIKFEERYHPQEINFLDASACKCPNATLAVKSFQKFFIKLQFSRPSAIDKYLALRAISKT